MQFNFNLDKLCLDSGPSPTTAAAASHNDATNKPLDSSSTKTTKKKKNRRKVKKVGTGSTTTAQTSDGELSDQGVLTVMKEIEGILLQGKVGKKRVNGEDHREKKPSPNETPPTAASVPLQEHQKKVRAKGGKKGAGGCGKNASAEGGVGGGADANSSTPKNTIPSLVGVVGNSKTSKKEAGAKDKGNLQSAEMSRSPKKRRSKGGNKPHQQDEDSKFEPYLPKDVVLKELKAGSLVKGVVRINPKFHTEAYVSQEDKSKQDYYIGSLADRNKALEGDVVALRVKPEAEWRDTQPRACVVYILEKVHPRVSIGQLSLTKDKKGAIFKPRDKRVPFMSVLEVSLPMNFFKHPNKFANMLYMGQLIEWPVPKFGVGAITDNVGKASELTSETKALLLESQVDFRPFPPDFDIFLPKFKGIPAKEFTYREDIREECVFTIDPLTAKDLDDAVSCKKLPNGNYEVGVHIADVTFHLTENTPLDEMVCKKATTTYLVDNVYHMLPQELCMMCSLLPGKDNLAFSVFWEMDDEANVVNHRFARTIIKSCCKLAYEHAQDIMDNATPVASDYPAISNENVTFAEVCDAIRTLNRFAHKLRERRLQNGALRIDQIKLNFVLDPDGNPSEFHVQEMKDANRMIEDFMLLANMTVARRIHDDFPHLAFLRCHDEPNERMLREAKKLLEVIGIHIGIQDSADLSQSLIKYNSGDYLGYVRFVAMNHMIAKPMMRAEYFCANDRPVSDFRHYALAIPIYTHFTSPIRRYADIMVHRLLSASLGYTSKPDWPVERVREIANNCNRQKFNAKRAGEASAELYLAHYIEHHQPFHEDAVVVAVQDKSFDAITLNTGTGIRLYANALEEGVKCHTECTKYDGKQFWKMNIIFPSNEDGDNAVLQVVEVFQVIRVALTRKEKTNKLEARLIRPRHLKAL